jgi:hypothetical protein
MSKRECGACSLCCKVMGVPKVKKDHEWCPHAKPGHGCTIYPRRPDPCRAFHCMWLIDEKFPDYWYPKTAKIVINGLNENGISYVAFVVDPAYPNRWREEPYFSDIKTIAKAGIEGRLSKKWQTLVLVGSQRIPIIGRTRLLRAAE